MFSLTCCKQQFRFDQPPSIALAFLQLTTSEELPVPVRQLCGVELKNHVQWRWSSTEAKAAAADADDDRVREPLSDAERNLLRPALLDSAAACGEAAVRRQLLAALRIVLENDYPKVFTDAVQRCAAALEQAHAAGGEGAFALFIGPLQCLRVS